MKKFFATLLALMMVFAMFSATVAHADSPWDDFKPMVVSFATANGVAQTIEKMDQNWMAYITEKSEGKITFDYYPGAQLGSYMELISQVDTGALNVSVTDISMFESYCPEFSVLYFPYIMDDAEHAGRVMYGEGGEILKTALAEATNTYMLGYVQHGARQCATVNPINSVEDCAGIIMRTPEAQNYITWCNAIGMSSTPMAMSEAYTAIQSGVAHGIELPIQALQSNGYCEVAPNVWKDAHMYAFQGLTVNQTWFDSLPDFVQVLFVEAWEVQQDDYNTMLLAEEADIYDLLIADGVTITECDYRDELAATFADYYAPEAESISEAAVALLECIQNAR